MIETNIRNFPPSYEAIDLATKSSGFTMASDVLTCSLLRTIAASKPSGNFLELGTGTGLSTAWILDGMDENSSLTSVDNDQQFLEIARTHLGKDERLELILSDAGEWIEQNAEKQFDYIFADTWHGKYLLLEQALLMLKKGGFYIIDDMLPQPNWPEGHAEKATALMNKLAENESLVITEQHWATGIVIGVKK